MIVIPNLFGAYQKGREAAIEANWNDLKNYENIEAMRTRNDRDALQLLGEQADYNINRSMMRDNGDVSALNAALAKERFYSDVYNARNNAMLGQAQYIAATNAAADGSLQNYANGQLRNTFNIGNTSLYNSAMNSINARAQYDALVAHENDFRRLTAGTVADSIAAGEQLIRTNQATRPSNHAAAVDSAASTAEQARQALTFLRGKGSNTAAIFGAGADTTEANAIAAQNNVTANRQTSEQLQKLPEKEREAQLAQLINQRVLALQNVHQAAQSGNDALVRAMAAQFGNIDASIERLGGKSQIGLVREAVRGALGVPPNAAAPLVPTQVPVAPATQTPASTQAPPTQVPPQLLPKPPQPTYTPNGAPVGHPAYKPQLGSAEGNVALTRPVSSIWWSPQHARHPGGMWILQGTNK